MSAENFCYWLKGFLELTDSKSITKEQMKMISEHLNLVFNKVTPPLQYTPVTVTPAGTQIRDWSEQMEKAAIGSGNTLIC